MASNVIWITADYFKLQNGLELLKTPTMDNSKPAKKGLFVPQQFQLEHDYFDRKISLFKTKVRLLEAVAKYFEVVADFWTNF